MNTRIKILKNIKEIDKKAFYELQEVSEEELSNQELQEIFEELSRPSNLYKAFDGDGINDTYMGNGIYIRPNGTTYSE